MTKRLLLAGVLAVSLGAAARADESRYQLFQGTMPAEGKATPAPVVLKVDAGTGDSWRLVVSGGSYWWVPIKHGVISQKKSPAAEEIPIPAEVPAAN